MRARFIELDLFSEKWSVYGLSDETLRALQADLIRRPEGEGVMAGTGDMRKAAVRP